MDPDTQNTDHTIDRRQITSELQNRSVQLFVTLASIGDAVITTDNTGSITFLNPVAEKLTGWTLPEAVGLDVENVFKVVNDTNNEPVPDPVQRAIQSVSTIGLPLDTVLIRKDNSRIPIDDSGAPIVDMDGNVLGAVLVFRDITERKNSEKIIKLRAEMDRMAARISTSFVTSPLGAVNSEIDTALGEIGRFLNADRSYVFFYDEDSHTFSCTHQWSAPGIQPFDDRAQDIPVSSVPYWTNRILNREYVYVTNDRGIPEEAASERELWQKRGVKTSIAVPMSQEDKVLGFIGVESKSVKPWPEETVNLLYLMGNVFASALARKEAQQKLEAARKKEVRIGSAIQRALLLSKVPPTFADFMVATRTIPSRDIDGDFFDFILHPNRSLDVIFGDVMGKGVPAALLAAGSKTEFLRSLAHLLAVSPRGTIPQPQDIVNRVHSVLTPHLINLDAFVTLSYVRFEPSSKKVILVDCGNTRMIKYVAENNTIEHLSGFNIPLGFSALEEYSQAEYSYAPGDVFVLYSDGVTEAKNQKGEMYGVGRLREVIAGKWYLPPGVLIDEIIDEVVHFSGKNAVSDDLTCVVVKIDSQSIADIQPVSSEMEVPSTLAQLAVMRSFIRRFCRQWDHCGLSDRELHLVELAVTEVASNIIRHAYQGREDQLVWIRLDLSTNALRVRLAHKGDPYIDWDQIPSPTLNGSREGGFGLYIIDRSVDAVNFGTDAEGRYFIDLTKETKR